MQSRFGGSLFSIYKQTHANSNAEQGSPNQAINKNESNDNQTTDKPVDPRLQNGAIAENRLEKVG